MIGRITLSAFSPRRWGLPKLNPSFSSARFVRIDSTEVDGVDLPIVVLLFNVDSSTINTSTDEHRYRLESRKIRYTLGRYEAGFGVPRSGTVCSGAVGYGRVW